MRARVPLLVALIGSLFLACGNDFDALFEGASTPDGGATPAADGGGDSAGSGSFDPSKNCRPPADVCEPKNSCSAPSCSHVCDGCGCTCPEYVCPSEDGIESCLGDCKDGSVCRVVCDVPSCTLKANNSNATFRCEKDAKTECSVECRNGALCQITCDNDGPCDVACGGASCVLRCSSRTTSCSLDCGGPPPTICADGSRICGTMIGCAP